MAFQVSPGVNVSEIDLTTIVPATSTTDGAVVGAFQWGPADEVTLVSSEDVLAQTFGKPSNETFVSFYTAANFLAYGNKLRVVRVVASDALNAVAKDSQGQGAAALIRNDDDYEANYSSPPATNPVGVFAARHPGDLGNSLKISICPSADAFESTLSGTVDSSGTALTGTGTSFLTELTVGDVIVTADGRSAVVTDVSTNGAATIDAAFSPDLVAETVVKRWEYASVIGNAPNTSDYAAGKGGADDELHVVVVDEDGLWTGVPGSVLERYAYLSKAADAKEANGAAKYYAAAINRQSRYVRWTGHEAVDWGATASGTTFSTPKIAHTASLEGGLLGSAPGDSEKILGHDKFVNPEEVDVSLVLGADATPAVAIHIINNVCESRKDCVAFLSPEFADVVNNAGQEVKDTIAFRNSLPSSSYAVLDSGWKYQYDKYNDVNRWVPLNGDTAGLCARTDQQRDPWWSPAGLNRGNIKNALKLAYSPNRAQRDDLYLKGVNSVVTFTGEGTVLWGDKTLLAKPSAFDRINVRRLFIVLEKSIAIAARYSLFEFNDEFTRASFRNLVEPYLRDVQGRRGIYDFRVVCDETNNTPEVIDRNEFVGDIYIKPARSINFIQLNFIAVRTGVEFEEIVGQF